MASSIGRFIGGISFGVFMDTSQMNRSATKSRAVLGGFVGTATKMLGVFGGIGAATGVIGTLKKASQSFETLNRSMNKSLAIMGNVSDKMRSDMTRAAIDVSRVTNASASQAADAYFFLASAGLNAEQSLAALPIVSKFAQAGNFDLALATDLATDAQSALGLTVKDTAKNMQNMERVTDVLVKANTLANASVEQFSLSLTTGAGAALKLVNKDIEEGVAVLAAFADQGVKAQEAGTAFGIVMRDLQTKAIKFENEFKAAKVAVFDATGDMRNMSEIIRDLERGMLGLSDQAKKTFLLDLGFSDKSVKFVQTLIGTSEKIGDYERALRSAGGTTAEVAGKMLTPLETAMNSLKGAFADAAQAMAPLVARAAELLQHVSDIVNGVASSSASRANALGPQEARGHNRGAISEISRGIQMIGRSGMSFPELVGRSLIGGLFKDMGEGPSGAGLLGPLAMAGPTGFAAPSGKFDKYKSASWNSVPFVNTPRESGYTRLSGAGQIAQIKSQITDFLGSDFGKQLGQSIVGAVAGAKEDIGVMSRTLGLSDALSALRFFPGRVGSWMRSADKKDKISHGDRGAPVLAASGSREAYEQRIRIQSREGNTIQKNQLSQLQIIAKNTAKQNGVQLVPINLAGN